MKHNLWKRGQLGVLLGMSAAALAGLPNIAHAVSGDDPYAMVFIIDEAYGRKMHRGNYDDAIAKLTTGHRRHGAEFAKQTNLCVAYTKTRELQFAEAACELAVSDAEERVLRSRSGSRLSEYEAAARRDAAIARSNLGVVRAVSGDTERAMKDFESALELEAWVPMAKQNLSRLIDEAPEKD